MVYLQSLPDVSTENYQAHKSIGRKTFSSGNVLYCMFPHFIRTKIKYCKSNEQEEKYGWYKPR